MVQVVRELSLEHPLLSVDQQEQFQQWLTAHGTKVGAELVLRVSSLHFRISIFPISIFRVLANGNRASLTIYLLILKHIPASLVISCLDSQTR